MECNRSLRSPWTKREIQKRKTKKKDGEERCDSRLCNRKKEKEKRWEGQIFNSLNPDLFPV